MANVENESPGRGGGAGGGLARSVARELRKLAARPPPGVRLLPPGDDLSVLLADIDGPAETPYCGGVFRVRLSLGRGFPGAAPRAHFETRLFHPNVAGDSGEVCVNTLARDWRPDLGLAHALQALRCLLIAPNPESALNAEAAALLQADYAAYFERARLLTEIHARAPAAPSPAAAKRARPPGKERRRVLKRL